MLVYETLFGIINFVFQDRNSHKITDRLYEYIGQL